MSRQYYEDQNKRSDGSMHKRDYDALDQGPYGTGQRHDQAVRHLSPYMKDARVLDLGCGTGLILPRLQSEGITPKQYVGVDFLPDRRDLVEERGAHLANSEFVCADLIPFMRKQDFNKHDVVLGLGIAGPEPFHSIHHLIELVHWMQRTAPHGILTFPLSRSGHLGEFTQAHFDFKDLVTLFSAEAWAYPTRYADYRLEEGYLWW